MKPLQVRFIRVTGRRPAHAADLTDAQALEFDRGETLIVTTRCGTYTGPTIPADGKRPLCRRCFPLGPKTVARYLAQRRAPRVPYGW